MVAFHVEILSTCSMLLGGIALNLFLRCRVLARSLHRARAMSDAILREERQRITSDIHDDLGQNLLTLKIELATLQALPGLPRAARRHLATLLAHTDTSVRSLRSIINGLRPVGLEQGLRCAIERQLGEFSRLSGIHYQLESSLYANDAACAADTTVFRVLQESLSNIARHAGATEVRIALCRSTHELSMTVRDNGVGIPGGQPRTGSGLLGIEHRVAAAGGCFVLASAPGQGTALTISIPTAPVATSQPHFVRSRTIS